MSMNAGQTRIAREMEAFRAAQADPMTQSRIALDGAAARLAHELGAHAANHPTPRTAKHQAATNPVPLT